MGRGTLRIHLGAAPGVGKTYAMLAEAHRRIGRGTGCVVAFAEPDCRPWTEALLDGLERIPPAHLEHRGEVRSEMDVDAVLARRPRVALVDELAHTNVPGSRNAKRWQDVEELLAAGIDVHSTLNIQHLESLGDVVESITGVRPAETVPDEVVRRAEQIELVDMTPEALRRRMAHGNIYQPDKVDAALSNYFRPGNLTALRELALLWVADRVDEHLQRYRSAHDGSALWGSRERIVVGLPGGPERRTLLPPPGRPSTSPEATASPPPRPANSPSSAPWWRIWAAPSTTSSATTSRAPCSPSPAAPTPPRSCWGPRAARPGSTSSAPASARPWPASPGPTWTCTSSPTRRSRRAAVCRWPGAPGWDGPASCGAGRSAWRAPRCWHCC